MATLTDHDSIRTETVVQVAKLMAGSAISAPMSGGQNRRSSAVSAPLSEQEIRAATVGSAIRSTWSNVV
jgi:hypothetical protein